MNKKIMTAFLAFALVVIFAGFVSPSAVQAQERKVTEDGFHYRSKKGGVVITGYDGSAPEVNVPDEIEGKR